MERWHRSHLLDHQIQFISLTRKIHLHNADVVNPDIYPDVISGYLSVPLTNGLRNIFMNITNKDIPNKSSS